MELKLTQKDIEMAIAAYVRQQGLTLGIKSYSFVKTDSLTCSVELGDKKVNLHRGLPKGLEPFKNITAERPYNKTFTTDYSQQGKATLTTSSVVPS